MSLDSGIENIILKKKSKFQTENDMIWGTIESNFELMLSVSIYVIVVWIISIIFFF